VTGAAATVVGERQTAVGASMRALTLVADRKLELLEVAPPAAPAAGEVQIRIKAIGLNHIDVWGWRGMAFAKRKLPLIVGVEASGEIEAVGDNVTASKVGDRVVAYGALTCGTCKACREGRDNLCENVAGMLIRSRAKPSTWKPMMPATFSHRLSRPSRQALQVPQVSAP